MPRPASPLAPAKPRLNLSVNLLGDQVYALLLHDIVLARYEPGERLNLDAIAIQLGISRTPVREAVRRLADEGFIQISRNSRTQVAGWSDSDMQERVRAVGLLVGSIIDRTPKRRIAAAVRVAGLGLAERALLDRATDPESKLAPDPSLKPDPEIAPVPDPDPAPAHGNERNTAHAHAPGADCAHRDPFAGLARFLEVSAELFPVAYPRGSGTFARGLTVPLGVYLTRPALEGRGFGSTIREAGLDWCAAERAMLRGRSSVFLAYTERVHRALG